jgi:hypothetical protein
MLWGEIFAPVQTGPGAHAASYKMGTESFSGVKQPGPGVNYPHPSSATRHNTPIHNILSTAPQLSISQKALGTLPEDGNVMPKHVGDAIHN